MSAVTVFCRPEDPHQPPIRSRHWQNTRKENSTAPRAGQENPGSPRPTDGKTRLAVRAIYHIKVTFHWAIEDADPALIPYRR